jgi:N-carbamoyl-L-amino-acid hydrolase
MTSTNQKASSGIQQDRLWQRLMDLASIGATKKGGVNREALTPEDNAARQLVQGWAEARGFTTHIDDIGNLFFRREGTDPDADPVVTGSHIDSQPTGGKFDGAYGVMAGLEALEACEDLGIVTKRPLEFVAWFNEEGGRFQPATMGSGVYAGSMDFEKMLDVVDREGVRVRDDLPASLVATAGAKPRAFGSPIAAYIEAHIEQGPRLEIEKKTIGVVTDIQGCRWFSVEVLGEEAHAGTTPNAARKDALKASLAMIHEIQELMDDPSDILRFTVGRMDVEPNSPNTVPARVYFTIDFRHPKMKVLTEKGDKIEGICKRHAGDLPLTVTQTYSVPPTIFNKNVVGQVRKATEALDLPNLDMLSGALHDAKYMNDLAPSGMIFVPCERGLSHNEAESAEPSDLADGARVLVDALVALANQ